MTCDMKVGYTLRYIASVLLELLFCRFLVGNSESKPNNQLNEYVTMIAYFGRMHMVHVYPTNEDVIAYDL